MKMTKLLWRIVSLWLCVAVVSRCPRYYGECTEFGPEPLEQEFPSEETEESVLVVQNEESPAVSAQSFLEHELTEEDVPKVEMITQEDDKKQELEASEGEEVEEEVQMETEDEESSKNPDPEASISEDQESASMQVHPGSAKPTEDKNDPSVPDLQEEIQNSVSGDAFDAEVIVSDLPPADCGEEEENPYDGDSPPLVLENTSNAHTAGTIPHADLPLSPPAVPGSKHPKANESHAAKDQQDSSVSTETDPSATGKDPEDIPTFDEWKRKMMEVEKEKTLSTHAANSGTPTAAKKVQKNFNNYASVECGAKILGANPEAKSTSAILKENMDLYMLNPCSNKIWFIIELCEPIQVKQLDIANFELFSSTPKDFLVSISDRYPTNKWVKLGTFHGRDERTVQSFPLDEHLYAKYVKRFTKYMKVELLSHFGTEHFCPLSLIRVFGTSMVEEYENADTTERAEDPYDDLEYPFGTGPGEVELPKNLIGSAKDAILNMVNVAVTALGGNSETNGNATSQDVNMTEPLAKPQTSETSPEPENKDVEAPGESAVGPSEAPPSETASPPEDAVEEQIVIPLEKEEEESIGSTITLLGKEDDEDKEKKDFKRQRESSNFCPSLSSSCSPSLQEILQQQCSLLLPHKRKSQTGDRKPNPSPTPTPVWIPPTADYSSCPVEGGEKTERTPEPKPESDAALEESVPVLLEPSRTAQTPPLTPTESTKLPPAEETPPLSSEEKTEPSAGVSVSVGGASEETPLPPDTTIQTDPPPPSDSEPPAEPPVEPADPLLPAPDSAVEPDVKAEDRLEDASAPSSGSPAPPASSSPLDVYAEPFNVTEQNGNQAHGSSQKESVFMRLNNRIKALEVNMSLSGRYLEQLSQRYRKQMEEMQRAFNKTIIKLQNTSKVAEEQDLRQTESIQALQGQLENVTQLVLNLSVRVGQLQSEVSDRQNYLLLSLALCLCLGLLVCVNHHRISVPPAKAPEPPEPKGYARCCPESRPFTSCDETFLKRSASYPLINSESFQLASTEGAATHNEESRNFCGANKKKRRRKLKAEDKVETLEPSFQAVCNGVDAAAAATPAMKRLLLPSFRDSPSEGSSEASSHSDDPSFCGIPTACTRLCDPPPHAKTRAEKRAPRRRRPKVMVDLLRTPHRESERVAITLQDILKQKPQQSARTFVSLTGPV